MLFSKHSFHTVLLCCLTAPALADQRGSFLEFDYGKQGERSSVSNEDISSSGSQVIFHYRKSHVWTAQLSYSELDLFTDGYLSNRERGIRRQRGDGTPKIDNWTELQLAYDPEWLPKDISVGVSWQRLDFDQFVPGYTTDNVPTGAAGPSTKHGYAVHFNWNRQLSERWACKVDVSYLNSVANDIRLQGELSYAFSPKLSAVMRIRDYAEFAFSVHEVGIRYRFK